MTVRTKLKSLLLSATFFHGCSKIAGTPMELNSLRDLSLQPSSTSRQDLISERLFSVAGIDSERIKNHHLATSTNTFHAWGPFITEAAEQKRLICFEDGESDDQWQNLLSAERGVRPTLIFHRGGHYALRNECIKRTWKELLKKFPGEERDMPEILAIHGTPGDKLSEFDKAEGQTLFSADQIERLRDQSTVGTPEYNAVTEKSYNRLLTTLQENYEKNQYTVAVLKTAPTGLARALTEFPYLQKKVIAIWVGPMTEIEKSGRLMARYNYYQDFDAADSLLACKELPIFIVSPLLGGSQMTSVIDKAYMQAYRSVERNAPAGFNGFKRLAEFGHHKDSVISKSMMTTTKLFRDIKIEAAEKWKQENNQNIAYLEQQIEANVPEKQEYQEKLAHLLGEKRIKVDLGEKWGKLVQKAGDGFIEYCPIDPAAEQILDPELRSGSVWQVMMVNMERILSGSQKEIQVTPDLNGHVFLVTGLHSKLIEGKYQNSILWGANGEPKVHKLNQWIRPTN